MLSLRGLSKTYATGTKALADITIEVGAGEILAVVGGSGCGKTTLLRLVGGLDQASAGTTTQVSRPEHPALAEPADRVVHRLVAGGRPGRPAGAMAVQAMANDAPPLMIRSITSARECSICARAAFAAAVASPASRAAIRASCCPSAWRCSSKLTPGPNSPI